MWVFWYDSIQQQFISFYNIWLNLHNNNNILISSLIGVSFTCMFPQNLTVLFTIKLIFTNFLLILVRGGTPRYRYDYLTKLGWLKFLSNLIVLFVTLIFCCIYI